MSFTRSEEEIRTQYAHESHAMCADSQTFGLKHVSARFPRNRSSQCHQAGQHPQGHPQGFHYVPTF